MEVCKYANMQVCRYARMQVCKYLGIHVCMYAQMHICKYASMQVCNYVCMQVCRYVSIQVCNKKMKVRQPLSHKAVISSFCKPSIKSIKVFELSVLFENVYKQNFFLKTCSVWYATWEHGIKSESLAFTWWHNSHLVTFVTNHRILKFLFQKLFSLVC